MGVWNIDCDDAWDEKGKGKQVIRWVFFDRLFELLFSFNSFIKNLGNMKLIISGKRFDMQKEKPELSWHVK